MTIKVLTMQKVNETTSKITPTVINTKRPLASIEKHLMRVLKNARIDEWTNCKKIVTKENKKWDELTYNCIFVDEHGSYHFGCFAHHHPSRYLIRKTFKTLRGMINYLPKFVA